MTDTQARAMRTALARVLADDRQRDAARDRHPSSGDPAFTTDPTAIAWAS